MTEQHMPARIWVRSCGGGVSLPSGATYVTVVGENRDVGRGVAFVRADIAERLAEALERSLSWLTSYPGEGALGAYEQARSALSAFKAGQSEVGHG